MIFDLGRSEISTQAQLSNKFRCRYDLGGDKYLSKEQIDKILNLIER